MLKATEIAFSCYSVTDIPRARAFYEGVLNLTPTLMTGEGTPMQWIEYDIGGSTLSIGSAPGWKPSADGCTVGLEMEDFDAAIAHLRAHQVKFRVEPFPTPVCQMAMVLDPDGNCICIHKRHAIQPPLR
jgi:predicted enzyme related to lactoylglutathione lyase